MHCRTNVIFKFRLKQHKFGTSIFECRGCCFHRTYEIESSGIDNCKTKPILLSSFQTGAQNKSTVSFKPYITKTSTDFYP